MEGRQYLQCLGHPVLFSSAGEPIRFRTRKHLALLVYLAVEGRGSHRRDRLAEFLWPKVPSAEARHSLATALSILRPRLLPRVIESNRDYVTLCTDCITLDIDRLSPSDLLTTTIDRPIELAGFLEGFEIPDSSDFSLWKDRQQARLLPKIMAAFTALIDQGRRNGDTRQIDHLANRMMSLDELCEEAVRAKMEVLALSGDRLSALKLFEQWRVKIDEELSARPSEQLTSMASQLRRRGWEGAFVGDIPSQPSNSRSARTFVGRSVEYRMLYESLEEVRRLRRTHVMVLGDSGVGKTTLVERFTTASTLEGAIVSRVQCYELEREIPYATVAGLVVALLERPEILGTPPEALADISRIVPQIRQRFCSIPQPKDTQGETARLELTESFHQLLVALAETAPVLLVIDDLHLADDASLAVLHLLVRRATNQRIMLIMVARPGELAIGSQSRRLREMASGLSIREIELSPLTDSESTELLDSLTSDLALTLPLPVRRALLSAAAGYPMVLELLVQDWQASGGQSLGLALSAMTTDLGVTQAHSAAYQQFLNRIMRTAEPSTTNVLYLASVLGPRLNDLWMYSLASLSLGQTMAGLAQLTEMRVLRDGSRGLEFVNELVRAEVYASVPSSVRRALHGAVADRLLGSDGGLDKGSGLEIAWHCLRAGRANQAKPHLVRGARQAMRRGAPHVAERALASALPSTGVDDYPELLLLLVEALQEQGRWRDSLDQLANLPATCSQDTEWLGVVLEAFARLSLGASLLEETRSKIPLLIAILRESRDGRTQVIAARVVTHFASVDRDAEAAVALLPLVATIGPTGLDEDSLSLLGLTRAMLLWLSGDTTSSYALVEQTAASLLKNRTENTVTVQLLTGLGTLSMHQGFYRQALHHYCRAAEMATRLGNDTLLAAIHGNLAICYGRLGDYKTQLYVSEKAPRPWGADFGGFVEILLAYCEALALIMLGRASDAIGTIERLDRRLQGAFPSWMNQAWLLWKADLLLCAGKGEEALFEATSAIQGFDFQLQSPGFAGPFSRWLGHLATLRQEKEKCREALQALLGRRGTFDALDEVEMLCAAISIGGIDDHTAKAYQETIGSRLDRLPAEVEYHLRRLGSLAMPPLASIGNR